MAPITAHPNAKIILVVTVWCYKAWFPLPWISAPNRTWWRLWGYRSLTNKGLLSACTQPSAPAAFGVERVSAQDAFYHLMAKVEKTAVVPPVMECCDSNAVPVQYAMVILFQMCCVIHCAISSLMHYMGFYSTLEETQINFQNDLDSVSSYSPPSSPSHPSPPPFLHPHPNEGGGDEGVVWYHLVLF